MNALPLIERTTTPPTADPAPAVFAALLLLAFFAWGFFMTVKMLKVIGRALRSEPEPEYLTVREIQDLRHRSLLNVRDCECGCERAGPL